MPIGFTNNISIGSPYPLDSRYSDQNSNPQYQPYTSTVSVCSSITYSVRYQGLTVLVGTSSPFQEYWWQDGTSDSQLVIKQKVSGLLQYSGTTSFPSVGSPNILYIDQTSDVPYYWSASSSNYLRVVETFKNDLGVYLSSGYTFGKYANGATISAKGKTPGEVILDAISQPLIPTVNITVAPTTIPYNTSSIVATISVSYTIRSSGAIASTGIINYGTINPPATFFTSSLGPNTTYVSGYITQSITYSTLPINITTSNIYYRYTVTDTQGATSYSNAQITMSGYSQPTVATLTAIRTSPQSGEPSDIIREMGNVGSTISSSVVNINSPLVPLLYYQLSYSNNGGDYTNIGSTISITYSTSISTTFSNAISPSAITANFRLTVTDIKQSTVVAASPTITFYYPYYCYRSTSLYTADQIASWISVGGTFSKFVASSSGTVNVSYYASPQDEYLYLATPISKTGKFINLDNNLDSSDMSAFFNITTKTITTSLWTTTYSIHIAASTKKNINIDGYSFS